MYQVAIEVLLLKFIDDFFCKASLADKIKIAASMIFSANREKLKV
jgi:hypothetical protein